MTTPDTSPAVQNVRVLQFRCPNPPADQLRAYIAWVLSEASGLAAIIQREGGTTYKTQAFSADILRPMYSDPDTYWCRYDALLAQLGRGRDLMAMLVEGPRMTDAEGRVVGSGKGIVQLGALNVELGCHLELIAVDDLVVSGYLPPPEPETPPT